MLLSRGRSVKDPNAFPPIDKVEGEIGKRYLDQDINTKENPYGLTAHDIEQIDELLKN